MSLVGSTPTASASGSWSNRKTSASHAEDPGATPGDSTRKKCSPVVQRSRRLVHTQETMVQLHPGLLVGPGTPIGRAAWLKPRRLPVRFRLWALGPVGNLADHLGLEPGMLWVRLPPGPSETHRPRGAAWSARLPVTQEIAGSNPVEGALDNAGAVRKSAKRPSSNLGELRVRVPPAPLRTCAGWALVSLSGCNPPAFGLCRFNSCPAHFRHGPFVYRHRMPDPRSGEAGSTPARATEHDQVAQLADARRSERRAARHGSSTLPLVTDRLQARQVSNWLSYGRCARFDTGACNCGWASAQPGLISLDRRCATPGPATDRVRKREKRRGREPRDFAGSTPVPVTEMIPWSNGEGAWVTTRKAVVRLPPDHSTVCRCFGSTPPRYGGRSGSTPGRTSRWAGMFPGGD